MGTRGLTIVQSKWESEEEFKPIATIYRHFDNYVKSHGQDLFDFLDGLILVNGIPPNPPKRFANGAGRLASQVVVYLEKVGAYPDLMEHGAVCGQEYEYYVNCNMREMSISIVVMDGPITAFGLGGESCNGKIFSGTVKEFGEWVASRKKLNS